MTSEERRRILSPAEIADARRQATTAVAAVGIPSELIERLRPVLAPVAELLANASQHQEVAA
jgi:anti-sigma regulatory factor (Ser/Thr protein kinase)